MVTRGGGAAKLQREHMNVIAESSVCNGPNQTGPSVSCGWLHAGMRNPEQQTAKCESEGKVSVRTTASLAATSLASLSGHCMQEAAEFGRAAQPDAAENGLALQLGRPEPGA